MTVQTAAPPRTFSSLFDAITSNVAAVLIGKKQAIELAVICLLADGHLLIEDVPGVGKTSLAKALAGSIECTWKRVQFTPDMLPGDLIGVSILQRSTDSFVFQPGPIFANIVLADEINRASPKTQSALLEAMEERQVSADGTSHQLTRPFMVVATQNPVEHEGTFRLPESQLDRFLMRLSLGYPDRGAEMNILGNTSTAAVDVRPVVSAAEIRAMIGAVRKVRLADSLKGYLVDLSESSRRHPALLLGVSPRGTLQLARAAQACAATRGRDFVIPADVHDVAQPVLAHRLIIRGDAAGRGFTGTTAISEILARVPVPEAR
jgi:MoxR-like ATPase